MKNENPSYLKDEIIPKLLLALTSVIVLYSICIKFDLVDYSLNETKMLLLQDKYIFATVIILNIMAFKKYLYDKTRVEQVRPTGLRS